MSKHWIIDFSFYIWNGSYANKVDCTCNKNSECSNCNGKGYTLLVNKNGLVIGGLYSILQQVIDKVSNGWIVSMAFDPPRDSLKRTKLLDTYKAQRTEKPSFISDQIRIGKKLFSSCPIINCYTSDDAESDDVMAVLAMEYNMNGEQVVIASRDKDMFPLLKYDNISIYRDMKHLHKGNFDKKHEFPPERFNEYLAIAGDSADNFKFFTGLGDVAACYLIKNTEHITDIYKPSVWNKLPEKYKKILQDKEEVLDIALQIATLDYDASYYKVSNYTTKEDFKEQLSHIGLSIEDRSIDMLFMEE